jgi:bacterioferritin-associated ferredoxin
MPRLLFQNSPRSSTSTGGSRRSLESLLFPMIHDRQPSDRCTDCPGRLVCRCLGVTEDVLTAAMATYDIRSVKDIQRHTGAGDGCTACHARLKCLLQESASSSAVPICSVR